MQDYIDEILTAPWDGMDDECEINERDDLSDK
jgi:hypothetical protein